MLRILKIAVLALAFITWTPYAAAQIGEPANYSDAELKSFAVAMVKVAVISDIYMPKLIIADTAEQQRQVEQVASREMTQAVEDEGMTIERFHQILAHARDNPEIAERVKQHLMNLP